MSETTPAETGAENVLLSDEPRAAELIRSAVMRLWESIDDLTRLRSTQRDDFRVTIFGSARVDPGHWVYAAVRDLAQELASLGCTIVTGGGPGLMQAANEGSARGCPAGDARSVGIRVHLPFEQDANPFVTSGYEHRTFFSRLHHFALVSDAFVVVPGGVGTVLETMLIWQLLQVRKMDEVPLVLVGPMWNGLVDWHRAAMLRPGFELASAEDMDIPRCVPDSAAALVILREAHARWRHARGG
jgi:uncharacterized protein (TIGR00730 family)